MSNEDLQCLVLGRKVMRMIRDLLAIEGDAGNGYAEQGITVPGRRMTILVCTPEVAEAAKGGITQDFKVDRQEAKQQNDSPTVVG